MKILHITYIYPPKLGVADGITSVVYNVTKELARRGHEVAVLTSDMLDLHGDRSLQSGHSVINGVDVYYSKSVWRSKTFIATPDMFSLLSKKLIDYDVIHVHDCRSFQGIGTFLFAMLKKVPYVFQPHGSYLCPFSGSSSRTVAKIGLDKLICDRILQNAYRVIALNQAEAEAYESTGVPFEKIAVVPNGIDLLDYADLPLKGFFKRKLGIPDGARMVLYLGRVHRTKGIDVLIEAYSHVVKAFKKDRVMLVIAGPDDGYLSGAKSLASSLDISDSVFFTGFISSEDKLGALVDADLFITPSFYGFPMTFLEACAVGTPIVTTTLGDKLDWIDGDVGFVTQPTKKRLSEAIYSIISDDNLHEQFSRKCIDTVQSRFSIEAVTTQIEKLYEGVISCGS